MINNPFKESINEVDYYSKKIDAKKNKNEFDTTESRIIIFIFSYVNY